MTRSLFDYRATGLPPRRPSVDDMERLLSDWFGRPVVMFSSARAGLRIVLQAMGLSRYEHQMEIPPYISRCVTNAIGLQAFPVIGEAVLDATLVYHQYGFPQRRAPYSSPIEDCAHAFYAKPHTGDREWFGDYAIFSLVKFFPTTGFCGGVISRTQGQANALRELLADYPVADETTLAQIRGVFANTCDAADMLGPHGAAGLEAAFELLVQYPHPDAMSYGGVPTSLHALGCVGDARAARVEVFRATLGAGQPEALWAGNPLPYALPYFSESGTYHVDVRRNMADPDYQRCFLLPAHQDISLDDFEAMCRAYA